MTKHRRVVVTGQGVVTPLGTGVDRFWAALKNGESGIRQLKGFSTEDLYITIAGEVPDYEAVQRNLSKPLMLADKYSQFAGFAAREAVTQSGLEFPSKARTATVPLASSVREWAGSPRSNSLTKCFSRRTSAPRIPSPC
jgi:nodulation protein E